MFHKLILTVTSFSLLLQSVSAQCSKTFWGMPPPPPPDVKRVNETLNNREVQFSKFGLFLVVDTQDYIFISLESETLICKSSKMTKKQGINLGVWNDKSQPVIYIR